MLQGKGRGGAILVLEKIDERWVGIFIVLNY